MQDECHTGDQEGEITPPPRHSLLDNPSPSLTPWSHFPHPDHFPDPVSLLIVPQSFTLPQIPVQFPSLSWSHQIPGEVPALTQLLCKSAPQAFSERWFHVATALVQEIVHSLAHQTCPGQTAFWGTLLLQSNSFLQFLKARFGAGSWTDTWCIPNSETTQVFNFKSIACMI